MDQRLIAIYSRKSKFTGTGESIANQIELCRVHISTLWGPDAAQSALVFEDEGFSGGNLNRPDFRRMMDRARAGQLQAIVVYRLDRISRSIGDFAALIQDLERLGVAFVSIKEQFDTASPMGRAMMYIASVFSQLERETIAERIRDNLRELAKTGRWLGGVTPTGFASEAVRTVSVDGRAKRACRLRLVPEEARAVERIYRTFLETGSLTETEAALGDLRTKTGRPFTRFAVKAILQNPVYLTADEDARDYFLQRGAEVFSEPGDFDGSRGVLAYRRTRQEKGRPSVHLPVEEWIVAVGQHPGLIPARDWIAAQALLERSRTCHSPRGSAALLTGLLFCRCGGRMYPKTGRSAGQEPRFSYVCKRKSESRRQLCDCPNAPGPALDRAVLDQLARLPEDLAELRRRVGKGEPPPPLPPLADCLPRLTLEQRRTALRAVSRGVVWEGETARLVLWGAEETLPCEDGK